MEVEYTLGIDEVLAFNHYHHRHSPLLRRRTWLMHANIPLMCVLLWALFSAAVGDASFTLTAGVILAVFSVVYSFRYPAAVRQQSARMVQRLYAESPNRGAFGPRRMTIAPETLTEAGEMAVMTYKWAAIDKIVEDEQYAYFYVSALSAFILPKNAFATEGEFHGFLETARRYKREAPL